ncbi:hypothetical protein MSG28_004157 [Choristoneura fumiferana]|uniref:Uncharacterized protein n=1 Tax=Choristoneura fumiferana TaxID=7141 RepID=A0ACC0KI47_CHOFU|nr:hypothetical protein MSG28_004157 [Choristoneura fumiferana]
MWSKSDAEADGPKPGTEVVAMSDMMPPEGLTRPLQPVVGNITQSSRVHVGHKFYKITQNVENTEMVKGHVLGLELISPAKANRLRCSVAVFVCWAFLVAFGLGFYLFQIVIQPSLEDIGLNETWYFHRDDWQAMPMYGQDFLKLPLKYVVIGHTGWQACEEKYSCIDKMMETQRDNLGRGFKDIVPNFLSVATGDFRTDEPNTLQFEHVNILLEQLVKKGVLEPDFVLYGQCQLAHNTIPPGPKIMDRLNELLHWDPKDKNKCLH